MDENISVQAAGPTGDSSTGVTISTISLYVNNKIAANYQIDGRTSITFKLKGSSNTGIYLNVADYNNGGNIFCYVKKDIYDNNYGIAIASDITNETGILPAVDGYIFRMQNIAEDYPIIKFNSQSITKCLINGSLMSSIETLVDGSTAQQGGSGNIDINITTSLKF